MTITANNIHQLLENVIWDDVNATTERLIDQWNKKLSIFDLHPVKINNWIKFKIDIPLESSEYLPYQKHIRILKKYATKFSKFFQGPDLDTEIEIRSKNVVPPAVIRVYYENRLDNISWLDWNNPLQWCTSTIELNYIYNANTKKANIEIGILLRVDLFLKQMERGIMAHSLDDATRKTVAEISTRYSEIMTELLERSIKAIRLTSI